MTVSTTRIDRQCPTCKASFQTIPSAVARGKGQYCSRVCAPTGGNFTAYRRETLRPIPADHVRLPRYRWPSERHMVPPCCGHCGARLLRDDVPTTEHPVVDVVCLICSREVCELISDGLPWAGRVLR